MRAARATSRVDLARAADAAALDERGGAERRHLQLRRTGYRPCDAQGKSRKLFDSGLHTPTRLSAVVTASGSISSPGFR